MTGFRPRASRTRSIEIGSDDGARLVRGLCRGQGHTPSEARPDRATTKNRRGPHQSFGRQGGFSGWPSEPIAEVAGFACYVISHAKRADVDSRCPRLIGPGGADARATARSAAGGRGPGAQPGLEPRIVTFEVKPATVRAGQPVLFDLARREDLNVWGTPWVIPLRTFPFRPELEFVSEFVCESTVDYQRLFKKN